MLQKRSRSLPECVFCGKPANSKEHIIPDWYGTKVGPAPRGETYEVARTVVDLDAKTASVTRRDSFVKNSGALRTRRVKIVCSGCNNGWMSVLEKKVKPVVAALAAGESIIATSEQCEDLATWVVVKTIVNEYTQVAGRTDEVSLVSIPTSIARKVMETGRPVGTWYIQLYRLSGWHWAERFSHYSVNLNELPPNAEHPLPRVWSSLDAPNVQTTTIGIGKFAFHSLSSFGSYAPIMNPQHPNLIWPPNGHGNRFLIPGLPLDDRSADELAFALYNALTKSGVRLPPLLPHDTSAKKPPTPGFRRN